MKRLRFAALAGAAFLGACGGGGSSSGGGGGTVVTPTPGPSTGVTPTPSPGPSYTKFADLTGDRTHPSTCAALDLGAFLRWVPTTPPGAGLAFSYNAAADSWNVLGNGHDVTFTPADRDTTTPSTSIRYVKPGSPPQRLTIGQPGVGTVGADYQRIAAVTLGSRAYQCVIGAQTLPTDRPTGSTVSFTGSSLVGYLFVTRSSDGVRTQYSMRNSTGTFSVNLDRGEVTYTVRLIGSPFPLDSGPDVDFGTITAVADIDSATGGYYTTQATIDGFTPFITEMSGAFFGPQGKEAGFVVSVFGNRSDGAEITLVANGLALR